MTALDLHIESLTVALGAIKRLKAENEKLRDGLAETRCPRCGEWFRDAPGVAALLKDRERA